MLLWVLLMVWVWWHLLLLWVLLLEWLWLQRLLLWVLLLDWRQMPRLLLWVLLLDWLRLQVLLLWMMREWGDGLVGGWGSEELLDWLWLRLLLQTFLQVFFQQVLFPPQVRLLHLMKALHQPQLLSLPLCQGCIFLLPAGCR